MAMAMEEGVLTDRLKSKETVMLTHSIKITSQKCAQFLQDVLSDKSSKTTSHLSASLQLSRYGIEIEKAEQVAESCKKQMDDYVNLEEKVSSLVESTQKEIETLNEELRLAKKVRQHKEQYETLAKIVNQRPSKKITIKEQDKVKEAIQKLEEDKDTLDMQINIREKQFTLLMSTIDDLTRTLGDDPFQNETTDDDVQQNKGKENGGNTSPKAKRVREDMEEGEEEDEEDEPLKKAKSATA